jgi:hypothetical protein
MITDEDLAAYEAISVAPTRCDRDRDAPFYSCFDCQKRAAARERAVVEGLPRLVAEIRRLRGEIEVHRARWHTDARQIAAQYDKLERLRPVYEAARAYAFDRSIDGQASRNVEAQLCRAVNVAEGAAP